MDFGELGFDDKRFEDERPTRRVRARSIRGDLLLMAAFLGVVGLAVLGSGLLDHLGRRPDPRVAAFEKARNDLVRQMRAEDWPAALESADKLARIVPRSREVQHVRGEIFTRMQRYDESIAAYGACIAIDPADAVALNNRAYMRALARTDLPAALEDVEQALAIEGPSPVYLDTRGYLRHLTGDHAAALEDMDAAIGDPAFADRVEDDRGELYFHRALIRRALGDAAGFREDLKAARAAGFDRPLTAEPTF